MGEIHKNQGGQIQYRYIFWYFWTSIRFVLEPRIPEQYLVEYGPREDYSPKVKNGKPWGEIRNKRLIYIPCITLLEFTLLIEQTDYSTILLERARFLTWLSIFYTFQNSFSDFLEKESLGPEFLFLFITKEYHLITCQIYSQEMWIIYKKWKNSKTFCKRRKFSYTTVAFSRKSDTEDHHNWRKCWVW